MWFFDFIGWAFLAGLCLAVFLSPIMFVVWLFTTPAQPQKGETE